MDARPMNNADRQSEKGDVCNQDVLKSFESDEGKNIPKSFEDSLKLLKRDEEKFLANTSPPTKNGNDCRAPVMTVGR